MQNPNHYAIGIKEECYSLQTFVLTFLRGAIVDALVVFYFVYYPVAYAL